MGTQVIKKKFPFPLKRTLTHVPGRGNKGMRSRSLPSKYFSSNKENFHFKIKNKKTIKIFKYKKKEKKKKKQTKKRKDFFSNLYSIYSIIQFLYTKKKL